MKIEWTSVNDKRPKSGRRTLVWHKDPNYEGIYKRYASILYYGNSMSGPSFTHFLELPPWSKLKEFENVHCFDKTPEEDRFMLLLNMSYRDIVNFSIVLNCGGKLYSYAVKDFTFGNVVETNSNYWMYLPAPPQEFVQAGDLRLGFEV